MSSLASGFVLVACIVLLCAELTAGRTADLYTIVLASVGIAFAGLQLALLRFAPAVAAFHVAELFAYGGSGGSIPGLGPPTLDLLLSIFQTIWLVVGALTLTTSGPHPGLYADTSNGYFACWSAVAASTYRLSGAGAGAAGGRTATRPILALLVASIVLLVAAAQEAAVAGAVYAIVVGSTSMAYVTCPQ